MVVSPPALATAGTIADTDNAAISDATATITFLPNFFIDFPPYRFFSVPSHRTLIGVHGYACVQSIIPDFAASAYPRVIVFEPAETSIKIRRERPLISLSIHIVHPKNPLVLLYFVKKVLF